MNLYFKNSSLKHYTKVWIGLFLFICPLVIANNFTQNKHEKCIPQCGHWVILRSCEILGVPINMQDILELLPYEEQGHSIYTLLKTLIKIGLRAEGRQVTIDSLKNISLPFIAHIKPDHYIVVAGIEDGYIYIFNGAGRRKILEYQEFTKLWTHKILRVWRDPNDGAMPIYLPRNIKTAPCIQFKTLLIDKGEIPSVGEYVEYTFPFQNLGKADLIIQKVHTDCGCMESGKPKEPIPSMEQGQITLKYSIKKGIPLPIVQTKN